MFDKLLTLFCLVAGIVMICATLLLAGYGLFVVGYGLFRIVGG